MVPSIAPTYRLSHFTAHRKSVRRANHSPAVSRTRTHTVTQYPGRKHKEVIASRHHKGRHAKRVTADRHAYPVNIFMSSAPEFDRSALPADLAQKIESGFTSGTADSVSARALVRAGVVSLHPMHGGIYWRREPVKYIIVHSTETGRPIGATGVIDAWSSGGRRHAGAQFVVDRDGTIYQAVDPDLATVHVNIFKTLPGINNDNSIGIEMVHAGAQNYPPEQRQAVIRLVTYLEDRYKVPAENIITHRYAQQGDHTDPVRFDWDGFVQEQSKFHRQSIAARLHDLTDEIATVTPSSGVAPSIYMQIHGKEMPQAAPHSVAGETSTQKSQARSRLDSFSTGISRKEPPHTALPPASTAQFNNSMPALRGPIEMDPQTASLLNLANPETPDDVQPPVKR